jgi:hypothetical protein
MSVSFTNLGRFFEDAELKSGIDLALSFGRALAGTGFEWKIARC